MKAEYVPRDSSRGMGFYGQVGLEDVHEANCEAQNNTKLLHTRHMQVPDTRNRQCKDNNICQRIECPTDIEQNSDVNTSPWDRFVPNPPSWNTFPDLRYHSGGIECTQHCHEESDAEIINPHAVRGEHATVEEEDRDFGG